MMIRRDFLLGSSAAFAAGAAMLSGAPALAAPRRAKLDAPKHSQINVGAVELHVVELGEGPPVLLVHGFPNLARGWRMQMEALATAGYRAIAPDMRGYGRRSTPSDPLAYSPFHTVGDLVGLLDALKIPTVTVVGHDFGANIAWNAALLRPDRFTAVFGASVPFMPPGEGNFLKDIADAGGTSFYMFDPMKPNAAAKWADAKVTWPSFLYWSSGSPPPGQRWNPMAGNAAMVRRAPVAMPRWANAKDVAYSIGEFERNGFAGPLGYYRVIPSFLEQATAFRGMVIKQPSFYLVGELDALNVMRKITANELRPTLPGLRGMLEISNVGHWPNREAPDIFNKALLGFLRTL